MGPHRHDVAPPPRQGDVDRRSVMVALTLVSGFFAVELVSGIIGNSLVLLADAGHMLSDVGALGLSVWAMKLATRPVGERWTFGLKRAEILAAAANAIILLVVAGLITVASVQRLISPESSTGALIFVVAVCGAVVNILAAWTLAKANRQSLNLRAAYAHVVTDLYAFVGTAIAGLVILLAHWRQADAVAALFVVLLMITAAWGLLRDSARILLQGTPENLNLQDVREGLAQVPHVIDIHDLHAWTLTSGSTTLSAHVIVESQCFDTGHAPQILDALQSCLQQRFQISHATFQLEPPTHAGHEDDIHL